MFLDMSEARITSISHLIVKIDKQFGGIKKQLAKLADLDMKNYFVLGRSELKLIMKSLTKDYDSSYLLTIWIKPLWMQKSRLKTAMKNERIQNK